MIEKMKYLQHTCYIFIHIDKYTQKMSGYELAVDKIIVANMPVDKVTV
jgi:hypothetical protein